VTKPTIRTLIITPTGNAGKTTVSVYLLAPRVDDLSFFSIETNNLSAADFGLDDTISFRGTEFAELFRETSLAPGSVIVDVGASNNESFLATAADFAGALDDFDLFVVPVLAERKSLEEALRTVHQLASIGIAPERIRLLPNRVKGGAVRDQFAALFDYVKSSGAAWISESAYIPESDLFHFLGKHKISAESLLDGTDYRALARAETDKDKAAELADKFVYSRMAKNMTGHLDRTFEALTEGVSHE